jgi:hypothetical protein
VQNADSVAKSPDSEAAICEALWETCQELASLLPPLAVVPPGPMFFREPLTLLSGEDPSELVHQTLIPLAAAFLDRGIAQWTMPDRLRGFYLVWEDIMTAGLVVRPAWSRQLGRRIRAHLQEGYDAEHEVLSLLDELGIADDEIEEYVTQTLLHLSGWAGMFARLAHDSDPILSARAKVRLIDFLAVRLELDSLAFLDIARRLGFDGPLRELRSWLRGQTEHSPALTRPPSLGWSLFQLMQLAGLRAQDLRSLGRVGGAEPARLAATVCPAGAAAAVARGVREALPGRSLDGACGQPGGAAATRSHLTTPSARAASGVLYR